MANSTAGFFVSQENLSSGGVRVVFKTYFIALLVFIGFIGGICCRLNVRYKLLRGRLVPLTITTGWIQGPTLAKVSWELRRIPGGWLGVLMLLATALDLVGEYGVAKTVTSVPRRTTAFHPDGMVLSGESRTSSPSANWEAFRWASQAQANSYRNSAQTHLGELHYGIYRFVTNDTNFMADDEDEIGYWSCSRTTKASIIYNQTFKTAGSKATGCDDTDEIYDNCIWNDLYDKDLLYGSGDNLAKSNVSFTSSLTGYPTGPSTHTVILTASNYTVGSVFDIRVAIDTYDLDDKGSKAMDTYHCHLRAKDVERTVEQIARKINIDHTLWDWTENMVGALFPGLHEPGSYDLQWLETTLQFYLNSMIMVAGGSETVTTPNTSGYEVGVVYMATIIPYWVLVVCIIVFLQGAFLVVYAIYLFLAIRTARLVWDTSEKSTGRVSAKEIDNNTPVGLLEWMTHAAYESRDADQIPETFHLGNWILSTTWHAGRRLGIVRANEAGQVNPRTPGQTPQLQYNGEGYGYSGAPQGYFPTMKTGQYAPVSTREVA